MTSTDTILKISLWLEKGLTIILVISSSSFSVECPVDSGEIGKSGRPTYYTIEQKIKYSSNSISLTSSDGLSS